MKLFLFTVKIASKIPLYDIQPYLMSAPVTAQIMPYNKLSRNQYNIRKIDSYQRVEISNSQTTETVVSYCNVYHFTLFHFTVKCIKSVYFPDKNIQSNK